MYADAKSYLLQQIEVARASGSVRFLTLTSWIATITAMISTKRIDNFSHRQLCCVCLRVIQRSVTIVCDRVRSSRQTARVVVLHACSRFRQSLKKTFLFAQ